MDLGLSDRNITVIYTILNRRPLKVSGSEVELITMGLLPLQLRDFCRLSFAFGLHLHSA